jgi:hypothetical protein
MAPGTSPGKATSRLTGSYVARFTRPAELSKLTVPSQYYLKRPADTRADSQLILPRRHRRPAVEVVPKCESQVEIVS